MADYDLVGNIAIIKSEKLGLKKTRKQEIEEAQRLMQLPAIKTVVEKSSDVHGRLRTIKAKHIAGEKNLIADYKENNCRFKFNIETCYFSPRLSNERKEVASLIKEKDKVLVMFAGVGVYPIVIYKLIKPAKIVGIELGRECCKYFKENLKLNKVDERRIEVIQGDVKKKVDKKIGKFDVIVMPRPNLKDTFLKPAFFASKRGTRILYYGFCKDDELNGMIEELKKEAKELGKKIKITNVKKAGEIAPYKHRWRVEMRLI
jgi:tRNA (guanine37-N1)-methyltransferase